MKRILAIWRLLRAQPVMANMTLLGEGEVWVKKNGRITLIDNHLGYDLERRPEPGTDYVSFAELVVRHKVPVVPL